MARGRDQHQARLDAIQKLGRTLSRRCRSLCELCGTGGVALHATEVPPLPEHPNEEAAILVCEACTHQMRSKKPDATTLRFLEQTVWSDIVPVQLAAIHLLRRLAQQHVSWATECLDGLWIDDAIQAKLDGVR